MILTPITINVAPLLLCVQRITILIIHNRRIDFSLYTYQYVCICVCMENLWTIMNSFMNFIQSLNFYSLSIKDYRLCFILLFILFLMLIFFVFNLRLIWDQSWIFKSFSDAAADATSSYKIAIFK